MLVIFTEKSAIREPCFVGSNILNAKLGSLANYMHTNQKIQCVFDNPMLLRFVKLLRAVINRI